MSDGTFLDQLSDFADEAIPSIIAQWRDAIDHGGTKTIRHKCEHCSRTTVVEVEVADQEELRKIVDSLRLANAEQSKQRAAQGDGSSARVAKLLRDRSELTDVELAEEIARLEDELGV